MMLRFSLNQEGRPAASSVLCKPCWSKVCARRTSTAEGTRVGTAEMGEAVLAALKAQGLSPGKENQTRLLSDKHGLVSGWLARHGRFPVDGPHASRGDFPIS